MRELQLNTDSSMTKEAFYPDLKDEIKAIVEGQRYWVQFSLISRTKRKNG